MGRFREGETITYWNRSRKGMVAVAGVVVSRCIGIEPEQYLVQGPTGTKGMQSISVRTADKIEKRKVEKAEVAK